MPDLNTFAYETALRRERLNLAAFDESLHPRLHGKFAKKFLQDARNLTNPDSPFAPYDRKTGIVKTQEVKLPDGAGVRRVGGSDRGGWVSFGPPHKAGHPTGTSDYHNSADEAVKAALKKTDTTHSSYRSHPGLKDETTGQVNPTDEHGDPLIDEHGYALHKSHGLSHDQLDLLSAYLLDDAEHDPLPDWDPKASEVEAKIFSTGQPITTPEWDAILNAAKKDYLHAEDAETSRLGKHVLDEFGKFGSKPTHSKSAKRTYR